jgi:predicted DNA-binding transcriptional regulator AlpA
VSSVARGEVSRKPTNEFGDYRVMSYQEAADFLNMTDRTLRRYIAKGKGPKPVVMPGTTRAAGFTRAELVRFVRECTGKN